MERNLKIKDIIRKLKEMPCSLVGNRNDEWLIDVLLKPGFERYNLIEWFLEKLEVDIEGYESLSSLESKTQCLLDVLSALGFCGSNDSDIVEGTATMRKQVSFWDLLSNAAYKRDYHLSYSGEADYSNISIYKEHRSKQCNSCFSYSSRVCESISLNHIFTSELQLFPAYLTKEMKSVFEKSGVPFISADIIRKKYVANCGNRITDASTDSGIDIEAKALELCEIEDQTIPDEKTVIDLEDSISGNLSNLQTLQNNSFSKISDNLKLFFPKVSSNEFTDIGPAFKSVHDKIKSVSRLKNSANSLKLNDSELDNLFNDISSLQIPQGLLTDSKLGEYIKILSGTKSKE